MQFPKLFFTTLFAVLFFTMLSAQNGLSEGYYINLKNDTIKGFFNFDALTSSNKVLFYTNKAKQVSQILTPDFVKQIETLDNFFISSFMYTYKDYKESLFVTKYADGNISLYKGYTSNIDEKKVYFINSIKMPLIRKISKANPKQFLNTYFKGCELEAKFTVDYNESSLLAAIMEINKCVYPEKKIVKEVERINKFRVEIGIKTAVFLNKSQVKGWLGDRATHVNLKPLVGLVTVFPMTHNYKLYTGINYFKRQVIGRDSFTKLVFSDRLGWHNFTSPPLDLSTNFLEIPIAIHYELNNNNTLYIPKFFIGCSILTPLGSKIEEYSQVTEKFVDISQGLYRTSKVNPSFYGGIGLKKMLKNAAFMEMNLKYAFETEDPTENGRIFSNRFELSFNYLFSLGKNN